MKKIVLITFIIMLFTVNIAFGIAIVDVACGDNHTVLLAEDGTVWTMGDNSEGQCGPANVGTIIETPTQILHIPKMQKIFAGGNMTMCVDENGDLYQIVDGMLKPLGASGVNDVSIINDASGTKCAVLTQNGDVYVMGTIGEYVADGSIYYYHCYVGIADVGTRDSLVKINVSNISGVYWKYESNAAALGKNRWYLVCEDVDGVIYDCYYFYKYVNTYNDSLSYYANGIIRATNDTFTDFQRKYAKWMDNVNYTVTDDYSVETATKRVINKDEILLCVGEDLLITTDGAVYDTSTGSLERNYNIYNKYIVDADVGANHKILLDSNGNVYAYGDNSYGQLGLLKSSDEEIEIAGISELVLNQYNDYGASSQSYSNIFKGLLKKGNYIKFINLVLETPRMWKTEISDFDITNLYRIVDLNSYFEGTFDIKVPTLIESLQEYVADQQSSLAYITSDSRVWIGGIANFSLMFEVNEDMTLRNTGTELHDIFTNGALNIKVYDKNGTHLTQAQGVVYNVYENGVNITKTITPNFVFKRGKVYQLECGIGNCFNVRGDTYTVKFEGMNASQVKDGVITQTRSSVSIAKFVLKVYVTELAKLT